ncbi:hypothetical protein BC937DRAFT_89434 [Endogone sp. FLAS-F59071]|nr:hypothetical protein BC937DRAFT_89434 [Endogone sp. FLAS-F59071]|eukprot:RUS17831.1 hypothetical protein BC937DRAFT_89434 [Endogone sp. FLAS-F59071]
MSAHKPDEDDLTPEEREEADRIQKEREEAEQATLPYLWKQTLQDVDVTIPVPKGTRGRDLDIVIKKKSLKVGLKGKEPIIDVSLVPADKGPPAPFKLSRMAFALLLQRLNKRLKNLLRPGRIRASFARRSMAFNAHIAYHSFSTYRGSEGYSPAP